MFQQPIYSQYTMLYHLRHVRQMGGVSWKGPIDTAWIANKIKKLKTILVGEKYLITHILNMHPLETMACMEVPSSDRLTNQTKDVQLLLFNIFQLEEFDFTCSLNIKSPGEMSVVASIHLQHSPRERSEKAEMNKQHSA